MNRATPATGWARNPDGTPGYTWNPITGCLNHVEGMCKGGNFPCYAFKLANGRLRSRYLANENYYLPQIFGTDKWSDYSENPFTPRFWPERLSEPIGKVEYKEYSHPVRRALKLAKGKGIFVCDMSDLFGIGVPEEWTQKVLRVIQHTSYNRYYLLTKQPQNLIKWSPFPDNAWMGQTITDNYTLIRDLSRVEAKVKYLSIEPLLNWQDFPGQRDIFPEILNTVGIKWVIIGALTGKKSKIMELTKMYPELTPMPWGDKWTLQPKIEWVREIVEACDRAGIPVFLKENLKPILPPEVPTFYYLATPADEKDQRPTLRQEVPHD